MLWPTTLSRNFSPFVGFGTFPKCSALASMIAVFVWFMTSIMNCSFAPVSPVPTIAVGLSVEPAQSFSPLGVLTFSHRFPMSGSIGFPMVGIKILMLPLVEIGR